MVIVFVRDSISHFQRSYDSQWHHDDAGFDKPGQHQRPPVAVVAFTSVDRGAAVGILCL
jgi:hypothetical protein